MECSILRASNVLQPLSVTFFLVISFTLLDPSLQDQPEVVYDDIFKTFQRIVYPIVILREIATQVILYPPSL